jgi:hypothetical protein
MAEDGARSPTSELRERQRPARQRRCSHRREWHVWYVPFLCIVVPLTFSGALIANSLLKSVNRPARIVVLEAREICSGASGRNAGHCRPDPHRGFTNFAALHGDQEAREICESEALVLSR